MTTSATRSRPVSISVPAPPPPTPGGDDVGSNASVWNIADLEQLLLVLCSKTTDTFLPPHGILAHPLTSSSPVSAAHPASAMCSAPPAILPMEPALLDGRLLPSTAMSLSDLARGQQINDPMLMDTKLTMPGPDWTEAVNRDWLAQDVAADAGLASAFHSISPGSSPSPDPITADAGDESLQRYKESLGLANGKDLSDPNDPRVCIIKSLAMETPGRDPVIIDLSVQGSEATLKDHPFTIKEGARFTMVATFKVQHEVLSGLRYVQIVKRKGLRVSKDSEMIGSYAPNTDKQPLYTKRFQEDEAPSGMLARGHYVAHSSFVDDDQQVHLSFEWSFNIAKEW